MRPLRISLSLQGSLLYEKEDSVRDWLNRLTRGSHALAVDPRKGKTLEKRGKAQREKKIRKPEKRETGGRTGRRRATKLERNMATYAMLSSFATRFFVLARQVAYVSHIEDGFDQNR